jgi:tRNA dimethylallyltransferase
MHNTTDFVNRDRLVRAIEIADYSVHSGAGLKRPGVDIRPFVIGVRWKRDVLQQRITERLRERLDAGMIDEVQRLHESGTSWERLAFFGLEYRYVSQYLTGEMTYEEMFTTLNTRIRQFAKRQETWFRKMERQGTVIHWVERGRFEDIRKMVEEISHEF